MIFELFIIYWSVSIVLLFFPKLIHRVNKTQLQKKFLQPGKIIATAHRGGMLENYDNSISAFVHSAKLGIKMLEMDVHKTKDERFLVIHDQNLKRITGQDQLVKDTDYDHIKPYRDEIYCDYGLSFSKPNNKSEKPCLLDDFFRFLAHNDVLVHLDVKTGKIDDMDRIIKMAIEHDISHRIVFAMVNTFNPKLFKTKYKKELNFCFPVKPGLLLFFYFVTGLLPFIPLDYEFYTSPFGFKTLENSALFKIWKKTKYFFSFINKIKPVFLLLIRHLQQRNIPVIYFVANEIEDFNMAVDCRANGIMTDMPKKLVSYLESKKKC